MLRLYNTATRKVEEFKPINPDKVGMYVCGLTVYNDMHLGHARTYISFDVIRRWLEYSGYEVTFVQNHTDIDDKIIQKANEEDSTTEEIASRYIERTTEDLVWHIDGPKHRGYGGWGPRRHRQQETTSF